MSDRVADDQLGTYVPVQATIDAMTKPRISRYTFNFDDTTSAGFRFVHVELVGQMDGSDKWAVRWFGRCVGRDGSIDFEPIPSSREGDWLANYRFDDVNDALDSGQALAEKLLAMRINVDPFPERID